MIQRSIPAAVALAALALFGQPRSLGAADNVIVQGGCCPTGPVVCCDDGCHKACRPTVETKDVAKRCYGSGCEDFCLPKCSSFLGKCFGHSGCSNCCGDGACHDCGKPRTRKYLVLYIRHHEECVPKCVVDNQVCPAPCAMPAPAPQVMPAPAVTPTPAKRLGTGAIPPAPMTLVTPMYPTDPIPMNLIPRQGYPVNYR